MYYHTPLFLSRLCSSLVLRPAKSEANTLRRIAAMVKSFILLRDVLRVLPQLTDALTPCATDIFFSLATTCAAPAFSRLLDRLNELLEGDVGASANAFLNRTQCCFALKAGVDSLLDVARGTYSRLTEQVHDLAASYRTQHNLPHMKVQYSARRGFNFAIGGAPRGKKRSAAAAEVEEVEDDMAVGEPYQDPQQEQSEVTSMLPGAGMGGGVGGGAAVRGPRVPPGFSILHTNGRIVQCTTQELNALNARIRDAGNDCLVLTEQVLEGVSGDIVREHLPLLNRVIDGVALLDMLCGFERALAATGREYVRPSLTDSG
jgi:DNA mismatch repair protein MSH4